MQESETEISFSLKNRNANAPNTPIALLLLMGGTFILCLGIGIFCWILPSTFLAFPDGNLGFLFYPLGLLLNFVALLLFITLPITVENLVAAIQEHFASELHEYHISIEKSRAKDGASTNWRAGNPSF